LWIHFILILVLLVGAGRLGAQTSYPPSAFILPPGESPLRIASAFHLLEVNTIDDQAETFKFSGVLTLTWKDSRQAYDPQTAGVEEKLYHGEYQFNELSPSWYPQVILVNATEMGDPQGIILRIKPDGTSTLIQTITAEARSLTDLRKYPFDHQHLEAQFAVFGFDDQQVVLEAEPDNATVETAILSLPEWELASIFSESRIMDAPYAGQTGRSSAFVVAIKIERQSFFMLRLVVIPLILIVILSFSVFWMDQSSLGDRMSVSFVGILTAVAYQIMVSDIMPQIAYKTWMNAFLSFSFLIMCGTVVINLRVGVLDKRGRIEHGQKLDKRARWFFPVTYLILVVIASLDTLI
jgi:hypothetical protein